jgi:DNA-binding transcriptional LysR family regulator
MESMFAPELSHSVLSAKLDLAIIAEPPENPLLTLVPIETTPLCVAMSSEHSAAKQSSVSINDLGNVGWMLFPRKANPIIYDRVLEASRQAAVSPVELHHCVSPHEAVHLISENFGVAFMAGRDRSFDESATGTNAACLHPDDYEHLWTGYVVIEKRSEREGCRDGAQAGFGERLKRQFSYWEILRVGR